MTIAQPVIAIVNPQARYGKCKARAAAAIEFLRTKNRNILVRETEYKGHGSVIAKEEFMRGHREFISIGGDGTHHEIINGLYPIALDADEKPTLSFLPFGTGNSFLRDFVKDVDRYGPEDYLRAKDFACDIVQLKHTKGEMYSINIIGLGFAADACLSRNKYFRKFYNFGYILAVILETVRLKSRDYHLKISGKETILHDVIMMAICNSRHTGGDMLIAPHAKIDDGLADIVTVESVKRLKLLTVFPKIFSGKHIHEPEVKVMRSGEIAFDFEEEIPVMFDGEMVSIQPLSMTVLSKVLQVRV